MRNHHINPARMFDLDQEDFINAPEKQQLKSKDEDEEEKLQVHWLKGEDDHEFVDYTIEGELVQSIFLNLTLLEFLSGLAKSR